MLTYLRISNFAILDEIELEFGPGMTVLTGETGAGKSLILDAVSLLRGGRAPADLIRGGADEARIEAVFVPPAGSEPERALHERLGRLGIDTGSLAGDGLVVRRIISKTGRGRVHIAGQLSTVQALAEVVGGLIDIAGQHEHQSLLDTGRHLGLLDRSGVNPELLGRMAGAFKALEGAIETLRTTSLDERARVEREEFLRFQLDEIRTADPKAGEDEALREEQRRLRGATRLHQAARRGEDCLYSAEGAVVDRLGTLVRELGELGAVDREMATFASQLGEAQALLEDAAQGLRRYADHLRADPERLAEIDDRLHVLSRMLRKHGPDLAALLQKRDEMAAELARLSQHEAHRAEAAKAVEGLRRAAGRVAEELSQARQAVAKRLAEEVSAALADLGMGAARLEARLERRPAQKGDDPSLLFPMSPSGADDGRLCRLSGGDVGWDRCELLLQSNVGEEARPLTRIASGGELSRVMLALRRVLGQADSIATCVFDEVDAGIGGATADRVGRHIHALSRGKQVLCITHLAQLAAYADQHLRVEKVVDGGRTTTKVRRLSAKERRDEIARMLGGARLTDKSRAHAEELLRDAR